MLVFGIFGFQTPLVGLQQAGIWCIWCCLCYSGCCTGHKHVMEDQCSFAGCLYNEWYLTNV